MVYRYIVFIILFIWCIQHSFAEKQNFSQKLRNEYGSVFKKVPQKSIADTTLVSLGKKIFFDTRLSRTGQMSCGTCHQPNKAFTDGLPKALGKFGQPLSRKTMSLYGIADDAFYFWDGRATTLQQQFALALENPDEMDFSFKEALAIINSDKNYRPLLSQAKASVATKQLITNSVVAYVQSIKAPYSRFDQWLDGNDKALSASELKGFEIFNNKANCIACHFGNHFNDGLRNDIGLADKDLGYGAITKNPDDNHMFKTVNLHDIKNRSPYMHDGSLKTLNDVITHYNDGGFKRSATDIPTENNQPDDMAFHNFTQPLNLDAQEKEYLVDFLKTL